MHPHSERSMRRRLDASVVLAVTALSALPSPSRAAWVPPFQGPNPVASEAIYQMKAVSICGAGVGAPHTVFVDRDGSAASNLDRVKYVAPGQSPVVLASGTSMGNFADIALAADGALRVVYRNVVG